MYTPSVSIDDSTKLGETYEAHVTNDADMKNMKEVLRCSVVLT